MAEEFEVSEKIYLNATFGAIDGSLNDVKLEIHKYPAFFLFIEGKKESPIQFNGELDYAFIKKWIFEQYEFFF